MAFDLRADEPLAEGLRRVVVEQVGDAARDLRASADDDAIHGARKACKRTRAVLRVARGALADDIYRRDNAALRDAARLLADTRDVVVVRDALAAVGSRRSVPAPAREDGDGATAPIDAAVALEAATERARQWCLRGEGWDVAAGGVDRVYRHGRDGYAASRRAADAVDAVDAVDAAHAETLHEWRKHVKYLWHAVELIVPAWPSVLGALADELHTLSGHLGDDHDLVVAASYLGTARADAAPRRRLAERRAALQRDALALGGRVYADRPKAFTRRLGEIVQRWQAEASRSAPRDRGLK